MRRLFGGAGVAAINSNASSSKASMVPLLVGIIVPVTACAAVLALLLMKRRQSRSKHTNFKDDSTDITLSHKQPYVTVKVHHGNAEEHTEQLESRENRFGRFMMNLAVYCLYAWAWDSGNLPGFAFGKQRGFLSCVPIAAMILNCNLHQILFSLSLIVGCHRKL